MTNKQPEQPAFLNGGGEMGLLTRMKDWSKTPVGDPHTWPASLKTMVGVILNSKFPMFLWWGEHLVQFYNDAYRPSLGEDGKHPTALGQHGADCWQEIWPTIKPLIDQVLSGDESTWNEDAHIPILRNGKLEEVFWTFGYSPVLDESGKPGGVLVTCTETTKSVLALRHNEERETNLRNMILQSPVAMSILRGPDFILEVANKRMFELWGRSAEELLDRPIFEGLPEVVEQGLPEIMQQVYNTGEAFSGSEYPAPLLRNGKIETVYLNFIYEAIRNSAGSISGIFVVGVDVSEQVHARKKIEESESKYRGLFETMDQGFCIIEVLFDEDQQPIDYRFLETNPVFERATGLANAAGKTARELIPNLENRWFELYGTVALTGTETRFIEGSEAMGRWFEVYAFRIGEPEGRKVALLFTDISERRKADEIIKNSERNLRNIILQAPVAMLVFRGSELTFDIVNQSMLKLLDRSEDIVGQTLLGTIPEIANLPVMKSLKEVYTTGEPQYGNEVLIPLMKNEILVNRYFNFAFTPLLEKGAIDAIMVVATDVTDTVLSRMKVEAANNEIKFITDFMPQLIWVTRPDGYHEFYNKQWFDYTGLSYDLSVNAGWSDVLHPDDRERAFITWKRSLASGAPYEIEYRFKKYTGEYRWFLGRALPLKDESGNITKWFGTCTDIDDAKKSADLLELKVEERTRDLRDANNNLLRLNNELEEITYVSQHDLQEPLRKITIFAEMVRKDGLPLLPQVALNRLEKIGSAARSMSAALRDVLDFASLSREVVFTPVDLNVILNEVLTDLELLISEKNAKVHADELPVINGIPHQMRQLFYNLLLNALKFSMPEILPSINIRYSKLLKSDAGAAVRLERDAVHQIQIVDNGIGFKPETAEKIFVMFQRLHSKKAFEGTGIGLALCKKVVTNHRGEIWARSAPYEGATFTIQLPAD
ncbi:MAG: PAS domain-containing protein [Ferruginibacter sp.]|nr:PAS domain-containing protein [Ferruginibacter sp.]